VGTWSEGSQNDPDEIDPLFRELEEELARPARFVEPSAAERARKPTPKPTPKMGRRNARKARKLRESVPEPRSGQRAASRRSQAAGSERARPPAAGQGGGRSLLTAAIVVVCVAGAVFGILKLRTSGSSDQKPVTNGATPSGQHVASSMPTPTLADPFAGTPAASYADGALGIAIPVARPVGTYSAAQVAAAYRKTQKMLIAAHLDETTLRGGSPGAFAGMLIPQQRTQFISLLDRIGLTASGSQRSSRTWVTSFAPGIAQLVGKAIKVHGAMYATTGRNGSFHVLRVHADYLFVYAVERPGQPATLMRIVVRDVVDVDFAAYTLPGGPLEPWWRPEGGRVSGARCDVNDGFVHPQFPNGPPDKVRPTGTPIDPYNQSTSVAKAGNCEATTGT
jgi:hypothetical protein